MGTFFRPRADFNFFWGHIFKNQGLQVTLLQQIEVPNPKGTPRAGFGPRAALFPSLIFDLTVSGVKGITGYC